MKSFLWNKKNHIELDKSSFLGDRISISGNGKIFAIGDTKNNNNKGKISVFKTENNTSVSTIDSLSSKGFIKIKPYDEIKKNLSKNEVFSLKGKEEEDFIGHSFEISGNGEILITGEPYNDNNKGKVSIYNINTNEKLIVEGDREGEYFGWDVSASGDGNILGIISNNEKNGYLILFKNNGEQFEELQRIKDEYFTPLSIKMSYDGKTFGISEKLKSRDDNERTEGRIRLFKCDNEEGIFKEFGSHPLSGDKINGTTHFYNFSLNNKGNVIIFGESFYSSLDKSNRGRVRVFKYDEQIENWIVLGEDFLGDNEGDYCGASVDINSEGNIIVFGEQNFTFQEKVGCGRVRCFEYIDKRWIQIGQSIQGEFQGDNTGLCVKITGDSDKLFVSEPFYKNCGRVRIFEKSFETGVYLNDGIKEDNEIDIVEEDQIKIKAFINPINNKVEEKIIFNPKCNKKKKCNVSVCDVPEKKCEKNEKECDKECDITLLEKILNFIENIYLLIFYKYPFIVFLLLTLLIIILIILLIKK